MNSRYLLVFIQLIALLTITAARILQQHDYNRLEAAQSNATNIKRFLDYVPVPHKPQIIGDVTVMEKDISSTEHVNNNLLMMNDLKKQTKQYPKKKLSKLNTKYAKRDIDLKTQDLKNALDETLKMPAEPTSESNTHWEGSTEFRNDSEELRQASSSANSLIKESKRIENEYKTESQRNMVIDKTSTNILVETSTKHKILPEKNTDTLNQKAMGGLKYYKGDPTVGQKLPGPNLKELMRRFKEQEDGLHRNYSTPRNFTDTLNSEILLEKFAG